MNFLHDDGDSSDIWPAELTEEEAMQIWLRVDRKQEEGCLLCEQQVRHKQDQSRRVSESQPLPGELAELAVVAASVAAKDGPQPLPGELVEHRRRGSISGSEGWSLGIPAARSQPTVLTKQDDHVAAYQQFIKTNGSGVADAHVASAMGPARPLERNLEEDCHRLQEGHQWGQEELAKELAASLRIEERRRPAYEEAQEMRIQAEWNYYEPAHFGHDSTPQGSTSGLQDAALAAQMREYERLSRAHHSARNNHQQHDYFRSPAFTVAMRNDDGGSTKSKDSKKKKSQDHTITNCHVAAPNTGLQDALAAQLREYEGLSRTHHGARNNHHQHD
eukprot:CAMPEP_0172576830 /NCGR_PEP_ID=MMETSP1067-20121228/137922_1 /TAXON_ID=265564 ORGANISM="Thalassiosira punctigera, Strain Tpunct2005C2" /NCGR_SAMPLE_ID=MMETSP1067 /ASSEMBLY_ACC=CAM_ASM_000444 /LENGTH=331 /DNA_ID=CAMNT_0013369505 /DNA_START=186 /DNA_END=1182 /DNA_ORIENTATION=-